MKIIFILLSLLPLLCFSSVVGISTHPLNEEARVISAELSGYMSQRNEMGMGLRYTQEVAKEKLLDFSIAGAQDSRAFISGVGMDFGLLREDVYQPRVSIKPHIQYQKFENSTASLMGVAPTIRKGVSANGYEFYPYLAVPTGIKLDNANDEFVYYASLSFGASMPFPFVNNDKVLLSLEGNKNMGASSDYVGCLVSWMWK